MAKIKFHPLIEEIRGKLYDDLVIKLSPQGELIIAKRPDMSRVRWSKAQKAHRQRFKLAVTYARAALAEPRVRARYERLAKKRGKRAWDVALSDYFKGNNLLAKS